MNQPVQLKDLIENVKTELTSLGYSKDVLYSRTKRWNLMLTYFTDHDQLYYCPNTARQFLKEYYGLTSDDLKKPHSFQVNEIFRDIRILETFLKDGSVPTDHRSRAEILPLNEEMELILKEYAAQCEEHNISPSSLILYQKQLRPFLSFCICQGAHDIERINLDLILDYLDTRKGYSFSTNQLTRTALRSFFKFLLDTRRVSSDLTVFIPYLKKASDSNIPSVWTKEEVRLLLKQVDRDSPRGKRDYAILLLAAQTGLRSCDIIGLSFKNVDWTTHKITITQKKTSAELEVPISRDVGWALIDYIRNGRPKSTHQQIFLLHKAPYTPIAHGCSLSSMVNKYRVAAGIERKGRYMGMHSLRHTLASILLENQTPLVVISDILGHANTYSTEVYLKVGIDGLRDCALDWEEVFSLA